MNRPHADLDLATHTLWQHAAEPLLRALWGDPDLQLLEKLDGQATSLRRFPDAAARVRNREGEQIAHTEFEAAPHPQRLPRRMHIYGNLLYGVHDGRFPVRSTVVVLNSRRKIPDFHEVKLGGVTRSLYRYEVVRIHAIPASQLARDPALAALAPLGLHATPADLKRAVACVEASWPTPEAAELVGSLYITGGMKFGAELVRKIITSEVFMLSSTYREILQQGIEKGIEKGREEGIQRGLQHNLDRIRGIVARQISLRFAGVAPPLELLARCDAEDLEAVAELVLLSPTPEALHAGVLARVEAHDAKP